MKTIVLLFALSCSALSEEKAPTLTTEQKLALRDAQVPAIVAQQKLDEYVRQVQKEMEATPKYQALKAASDEAAKAWNAVVGDVRERAKCADCELNVEKMTLNRPAPKQAKVEPLAKPPVK